MQTVRDLVGFIDASPTQFHAVHNVAARLLDAGFSVFDHTSATFGANLVVRDGALVAWVDGKDPAAPMRLIGAHTDSPNLRIRPRPDQSSVGFRQLAVEVYGGALLNSWLDRDLGIAGRVVVGEADNTISTRLFRSAEPQLRVAQLAIHLDRGVNESGLVLDKQRHLTPIWGLGDARDGDFRGWLAQQVEVAEERILDWDAACFDCEPSRILGAEGELLAAPRLDNLFSTFVATEALIAAKWAGAGPAMIALFDFEEVGSVAATGADSSWLVQILEQRALALGIDRSEWLASLGSSMLLSADMAHATHPNYPERHEPNHPVRLGGGPVVKYNTNAKYASNAVTAGVFISACSRVGVEVQQYSHRGDLACGSTIGPLAAAQLSMGTVDVGAAQLSMHSARELMAVADVEVMFRAFSAWLEG